MLDFYGCLQTTTTRLPSLTHITPLKVILGSCVHSKSTVAFFKFIRIHPISWFLVFECARGFCLIFDWEDVVAVAST